MTATDTFLASLLRRTGLFTDFQLHQLLTADRSDGTGLTGVVVRLGMVKEEEFLRALAKGLGLEYVDLAQTPPAPEAVKCLKSGPVFQYGVMPVRLEGRLLTVATADPFQPAALDFSTFLADFRYLGRDFRPAAPGFSTLFGWFPRFG